MYKRVISIILALAMAAVMLPTAAFAAAPPVYVAGKQVSTATYWVNDGSGGITNTGASDTNYNLKFTVENGTHHLYFKGLALNCDTVAETHLVDGTYYALRSEVANLTIHLEGENTITYQDITGVSKNVEGIRATGGTLTFLGSGSLSVTGVGSTTRTCNAISSSGSVVLGKAGKASAFTGSLTAKVLYSTNAGGALLGSVKVHSGFLTVTNCNCDAIKGSLTVTGGTVEAYVKGAGASLGQAVSGGIVYSGYQPASPTVIAKTTYADAQSKDSYVYEDDYFKISPRVTPVDPEAPLPGNGGGSSYFFYTILEGRDQTIKAGAPLTVRADAPYANFTGVRVDGVALAKGQYSAKAGSTIVTLSSAYTSTLAAGSHTLTLSFTDGESSTAFTIDGAGAQTNPNTGANDVLGVAAALGIIALISGAVLLRGKRK